MLRKSSVWLVVLISVVAVAFIASGCAKKQVIKEEAIARPVVETKKEEVKPEVTEAAPVEKPKEEAKIVPREEVQVYAPKEEEKVPEVAPQEEAKVPEVVPPEAAFKEEAKEEVKEEAKEVPREEIQVYAPKEEEKVPEVAPLAEAKVPEVAPQEEAKVPEVAPQEEAKEEAKVEAQPEEKPAPFDLSSLRIQFAFDDCNLSSQAKENLEKIASWMSKNPAVKVQIQGNTCNIGTAEYNLALGEKRAMSARKYLQSLGVSPSRLSTISYGIERPMLPNTDESNRSKNRRDEFVESK